MIQLWIPFLGIIFPKSPKRKSDGAERTVLAFVILLYHIILPASSLSAGTVSMRLLKIFRWINSSIKLVLVCD